MTDGQHQAPTKRDRSQRRATPSFAEPASVPPREQPGATNDLRGPVRTCIGCRGRDAQGHLIRIAVADNRPRIDLRRRLPGRGAYVHCRPECVERATRKGRLGRALRIALDPSHTSALRQLVTEATGAECRTIENHSPGSSEPSQCPPRGARDGNSIHTRLTDREMNCSTRPQRQFVDETRQAKGQ
jgi:uncharacterized protein